MDYKFQHAIVGGTFDHFHQGHKKLLTEAFKESRNVTIGIATEELFTTKHSSNLIEDYQSRKNEVSQFLLGNNLGNRAMIIPIHDIYGNSLESAKIDAIFVTQSTAANARKINDERTKKKLDTLEIIVIAYALDDNGEVISSGRIRKGEIDRFGNTYANLFKEGKKILLPESEKEAFRQPIGKITNNMEDIITSLDSQSMLITVGDIVSVSAIKAGRIADISIIDNKTRRQILDPEHTAIFSKIHKRTTHNPAGSITFEAVKNIQKAITDFETTHAEQLIVVSGEEDLLAIPAILLTPLKTVVLYGQFGKGIVVVTVSEQNKKHVQNLFSKFQ
jgi:cytidyltransferase-like protein